ncbi:hypothetical protein EP331_11000 [bacterium]|nr:MAG: hypothetical protein EP331_11000 [bacterium]
MNNFYNNFKKLAAVAAISLVSLPAYAQLGNIGELLQAGRDDANILAKAYVGPLAKGFGAALNSGWNMSASTHKFLGFDISIRVGIAQIPTADQTYDVNALGLSAFELKQGSSNIGPSFTSEKMSNRPTLQTTEKYPNNSPVKPGEPLAEFTMPDGIGYAYSGAPMVQVGIGLIMSTDVTVRYLPKYDFDDFGSVELIGASVKHNLNQWIPGGDLLPVNLALQAGFTNLSTTANLSIKPSDVGFDATDTKNTFPESNWENQSVEFASSGYTINALVGKNLNLLIFGIGAYVGIGIESAETTLKTPGNYPVIVPNENFNPITGTGDDRTKPKMIDSQATPLNITFDSANSMRYTAGVKVNFFLINIMAEYVHANYPMVNAGVAISLR